MPIVSLTTLQVVAMEVIITQAMEALARYELIKNYTDEQCQILIDEAKKTKDALDDRLANH